MSRINQRLIINASEVGEFVYCAKAWYLKRYGAAPEGSQLDEGVIFHKEHGTTVTQAARMRKMGERLSLIGLFLLFAVALIWFAR
jgi:hypothetical protein